MMEKVPAAEPGLAVRVRAQDPDRFLLTLLAPAARREALLLLAAFNHELVRALELPSSHGEVGPIGALIRLQWWREVVEGERRRHEVAGPLAEALARGTLPREPLLEMIAAREAEAEGFEDEQSWREAQLGGAGALQVALGAALGETRQAERLRLAGAAYAAGAMLRHRSRILASGRRPFAPADVDGTLARSAGLGWLADAGRVPGRAGLIGVLARRDLGRPADTGGRRGAGDVLALIAAGLTRVVAR